MMKPTLSSENLPDYKRHFSNPGCHRTTTLLCPQKRLIFIAGKGYLANSFVKEPFFERALAEKRKLPIHLTTISTHPTANKPNP
jgi:hypothetical protein